jgi:hypothetical protein
VWCFGAHMLKRMVAVEIGIILPDTNLVIAR